MKYLALLVVVLGLVASAACGSSELAASSAADTSPSAADQAA
jgi:hypothetical protein